MCDVTKMYELVLSGWVVYGKYCIILEYSAMPHV